MLCSPKQWIWELRAKVRRERSFGICSGLGFHAVRTLLSYSLSISSYCETAFCYSRWCLENCVRQGCSFITAQSMGGHACSWSKWFFTLISKIKWIGEERRSCSNLRRYVHIILGACLGQQVTSDSLCLCILDSGFGKKSCTDFFLWQYIFKMPIRS